MALCSKFWADLDAGARNWIYANDAIDKLAAELHLEVDQETRARVTKRMGADSTGKIRFVDFAACLNTFRCDVDEGREQEDQGAKSFEADVAVVREQLDYEHYVVLPDIEGASMIERSGDFDALIDKILSEEQTIQGKQTRPCSNEDSDETPHN